ncbi:hypothetical protein [Bacillus sp. FSL K6-3431]|uniref:hypothetical protein n=1 Tax=Bacillus sp. FSL K6-3431 TaxID=2921500 RepID=UPI0030F9C32C
MILVKAFGNIHRHYTLLLYPILFDLLSLVIGCSIIGFYGKEIVSIRLILEMGLPSVSHLANIPLFANNLEFLNAAVDKPTYTWLVVVIMIIIGAFLQGGYISFLYAVVMNKSFRFSQFLNEGKKYWLQFIFLEVIVFLGKIGVTAFLVLFFNIIGVFASLAFFMFLRIIFIYLEFSIVVDYVSIASAMKRSRSYLKQSLIVSLALIVVMYAVSSGISLLVHMFWSPYIIIGSILVYAYVMSVIQMALMSVICKVRN